MAALGFAPDGADGRLVLANTISVREGVRAGYGFIPAAWRAVAGALILAAVTGASYFYADAAHLGRPAVLAALVAHFLVGAVAQGALFRLALDQTGNGPLGLQWRGLESRLLGLTLLTLLFFVVVVLVLTIVVAAAIIGVSIAAGVPFQPGNPGWLGEMGLVGGLILALVVIAAYVVFVWLAVRLSLASAATAAVGRIQLLSTFPLTKGHVWRLLGSLLIVAAPVIAAALATGVATGLAGGLPDPATAAFAIVTGLLVAFVYLPAAAGLLVYIYRRLAPTGAA